MRLFKMNIEIVITAYNNDIYLENCIDSLIKQTHVDFNVVVIDDCSPSSMLDAYAKITSGDKRFRYVRNEVNLGGPISFMQMARNSEAKYIMWLHHDDWLHPEFLKKSYESLEKNIDCTFSYTLCSRVVNGVAKDDFATSIRPDLKSGVHDISIDTVINCWVMWSCALIRLKSYRDVGGLESFYRRQNNRNLKSIYRMGESDLYMFARLSSQGFTFVINERLCFYRDHDSSNTNNPILKATHIQDNLRTYDYIFDDIELFADEVRVVAKINSIGRLSMGLSLAEVAFQLLYKSMLGKEFIACRYSIISKLKISMLRFIIDDEKLRWPKLFRAEEIEFLDKILEGRI